MLRRIIVVQKQVSFSSTSHIVVIFANFVSLVRDKENCQPFKTTHFDLSKLVPNRIFQLEKN